MSPVRAKVIKIISFMLLAGLLTGCWNLEEVENRAFVLGLGFDVTDEGRVRAIMQLPSVEAMVLTPSSPSKHTPPLTVTAEGETAWQALGELDKQYPRKLYLGHLQTVIISTEIAKQGIDEIVDGLMRYSETDRHANVLLADDPLAVLSLETPSMFTSSLYVGQFYLSTTGIEGTGDLRIWRFWRNIISASAAAFAPYVRIEDEELHIGGYGLFFGSKLVTQLDGTQSRGVDWTRGSVRTAAIPLNWREGTLTVRNTDGMSRVARAGWRGDTPFIDLKLRVTTDIEAIAPAAALFTAADYAPVEEELARLVEAEARAAISAAREAGTDIFLFGEWVRAADPARWEPQRWPEQFKDVEVTIEVSTKIRGTDLMR